MKVYQIGAALILLALCLCGCAPRQVQAEFYAMDTVMQITACGAGADDAVKAAEAEVYRLEGLLSCRNAEAELARCNAGQVQVSTETAQLIEAALSISERTGGAYDPTLGALTTVWGFSTGDHRVPDEAARAQALMRCGTEKVAVRGSDVYLEDGVQLDLGGIGKGYAASRVREILTQAGVTSAIASLGGNVCAIGAKPDGSDWQIGLQDPQNTAEYFAVVSVQDTSVVTSGGYQRYFEQDGIRYHHILDASTGAPAESGLLSVSVVCTDDTLADALSTALYVMGLDRGMDFWRTGELDFEAVWMTDGGEVWITPGLQTAFHSERSYQVAAR